MSSMFGVPISLKDLFGGGRPQHQCDDDCIEKAVRQLPWVEEVTITHVPDSPSDLIIPDGALYEPGLRIKLQVVHSYPEGVDIRPYIHDWIDGLQAPVTIVDLDLVRVAPT